MTAGADTYSAKLQAKHQYLYTDDVHHKRIKLATVWIIVHGCPLSHWACGYQPRSAGFIGHVMYWSSDVWIWIIIIILIANLLTDILAMECDVILYE